MEEKELFSPDIFFKIYLREHDSKYLNSSLIKDATERERERKGDFLLYMKPFCSLYMNYYSQ